ncbi:hypothetical protein HOD41_08540 [bacterium]|jgi:hypothetical protein|nr:hypothetical protein [bacterium]
MFNKQLALVIMLALLATSTFAQVEFTFEGYSKVSPAQDTPGSLVEVFGIANPPLATPNPIPLDYDNFQYTLCVTGLLIETFEWNPANGIKEVVFTGGEFAIYKDALSGGSLGVWSDSSTFADGEMILRGTIDNGMTMLLSDPFGWDIYSGSSIGTCDLDGGSSMELIELIGYNLSGWGFTGTGISDPSPPFFTVPDGYDRVFGTKILYPGNPTENNTATWGQIKTMFR